MIIVQVTDIEKILAQLQKEKRLVANFINSQLSRDLRNVHLMHSRCMHCDCALTVLSPQHSHCALTTVTVLSLLSLLTVTVLSLLTLTVLTLCSHCSLSALTAHADALLG